MRHFLKTHSLSIAFIALFLIFTAASVLSSVPEEGWKEWFKNWTNNGSTEMMQLWMIVLFTKFMREPGSAESKDDDDG